MFKDTPEGSTHHDKDACYKCYICKAHFYSETHLRQHPHAVKDDVPINAQRTGDNGRIEQNDSATNSKENSNKLAKWEEGFDKLVSKYKELSCKIADSSEYDEVNMTRNIENPIIRSLVFQYIDSIRDISKLKQSTRKFVLEEKSKSYAQGYDEAKEIYNETKSVNESECECKCEECSELRHCGNTKCGFSI